MFTRITKREAKKRFFADQAIFFCPCKMKPGFPWNQACLVLGKEYLERAALYRDIPTLWEGTIEKTAWGLAYRNWSHYNTSWECGYYAHYYKET